MKVTPHLCIVPGCTQDGVEILPTVVLCRHHRKVSYHTLCELYHAERDAKAKDDAIHRVAIQAAGPRRSQPKYRGRGAELQGGQFESNRRKH